MIEDDNHTAVRKYARTPEPKGDESPVESSGCYGVRRSASGLSVMLDLRFQSGDRRALPYSHVYDVQFSEGKKITIALSEVTVEITGRRLTTIYERLVDQRLAWVQEKDRMDEFAEDSGDDPVIDAIRVETPPDQTQQT